LEAAKSILRISSSIMTKGTVTGGLISEGKTTGANMQKPRN